jgi:hypothetical protein
VKGDDAAGVVHDGDGAGLDLGHGDDGGADGGGHGHGREAVAGAHDVVHLQQEGAADGAAGVEGGVFLAGEAAASRSATASASPMASATVVDAVGTRLNGQASRSTEASSTTSECLARVEAKSR